MEYCINGISPDSPSNKLILYGCTTIQEFKEKLGIYNKIFQNKSKNRSSYDTSSNPNFSSHRRDVESTFHNHRYDRYPKFNATKPNSKFENNNFRDRNHVTCFNCSGYGHISTFCPDKYRCPKCIICENFGHKSDACPQKNIPSSNNVDEITPLTTMCKEVKILSKKILHLVDTGSQVTLMKESTQKVLKVSSDYGLEINFGKCQFLHRKIEFSGHIIENNKLFPSPSKTKSVVYYPEPKTTKEVQHFLGLTGYFRKFIPAYSVIAKPLSDLLRKDTPFNFDVKQKASFDELKRLLCQKPVLGFLHPLVKDDIPLNTYHIDHLGPLATSHKNYKFILAVIDSFTKFVWLYPTKTTSTSEVIKKLDIQKTTFENPRFLISDHGTTFTSDEFHTYCSEQNISHHHITTGLPRANVCGQVERINRTIISVLSKMSEEDPTKWFKHVPLLLEVLNSTFQRSINTTPFELLFGTQINNKIDLRIQQLIDEQLQLEFNENRELLRKAAKAQIIKVQNENKKS
ncbi:retrovirus-related Pol polyprotein from transposon 297 [Trichonephila inaurata madagascariensis]|uniref:RNA-directed DNA polymerase n=1 Tax=Trichonephila inaurata madagascariensis TaxID=2747483 RepID=A0A8X7CEH7_9ARAC|nr:retrovirus-related Pol polyprotein from transposon 297 [Trichonephila inaurata madagascariensis]